MIYAESCYQEMINSPAREIKARVELLEGSTLLNTFTYDGALKSFKIERIGNNSKFFGYGICQKLTVELLDKNRTINVKKGQGLEAVVGVGCEYLYPYPIFYVDEVTRHENTNYLTIVAYDALYTAGNYSISKISMPSRFTLRAYAAACASFLNMPLNIDIDSPILDETYTLETVNTDGNESIRNILDAIAEVTQSIYYLDKDWELTFKKLDKTGAPVTTIDKSKYFTLDVDTSKTLTCLTHVTELGDNAVVGDSEKGETQFIRNNPFYELRYDVSSLIAEAFALVDGLTIQQFDCKHRGNFLLEIGDKINLITKDNQRISSYVLDDTITYNGGLVETTRWSYTSNDSETVNKPLTITEAVSKTIAQVDKVNNKITLMSSEINDTKESVAQMQITANTINTTVQRIESNVNSSINSMHEDIQTLSSKVETSISADDIKIEVIKELQGTIDSVKTTTGYTFDEVGLTISKTGTDLSTTITEDGMTISRSDLEVLSVDNTGVKAANLHATTYLFVGVNSRFEDYADNTRTGCFWINR